MTREQFEVFVQRIEPYAIANPAGYRTRIRLLIGLGYACVLTLLLVVIGLAVVFGIAQLQSRSTSGSFVQLELGLLVIAWFTLKSLWIRIPPPDGIPLTKEQAPKLFQMVEEVAKTLDAPCPETILIDATFNAAAVQRPRLGVFGWYRNELILGLPFLMSVSPEHLRGTVAHELGHHSGNHGKFGIMVYRVVATWAQLGQQFDQRGWLGKQVFGKFAGWYVPYLQAYTFPLRRQNEYEADACEVVVTSRQSAAESLLLMSARSRTLSEEYWPKLLERVSIDPMPPSTAISGIGNLARAPSSDREKFFARASLFAKTGTADTHPAIADRLRAIGHPIDPNSPMPLPLIDKTAAEEYLGTLQERLAHKLDEEWRTGIAPSWNERHVVAKESLARLNELNAKATAGALAEEEKDERIGLSLKFGQDSDTLAILRQWNAEKPNDGDIQFHLGRLMLEAGDAAGLPILEAAVKSEQSWEQSACGIAYGYLMDHGRVEEAQEYYRRGMKNADLVDAAVDERRLTDKDHFYAHGLSPEVLAKLVSQLSQYPAIVEAHCARKRLKHFIDKPLYVLLLTLDKRYYKTPQEHFQATVEIVEALDFKPGSYMPRIQQSEAVAKRVIKAPATLIYQRSKK